MEATVFLLMLQKYINTKQELCNRTISIMFMKYFKRFFSQQYGKKTGLNGCLYNFFVDYRAFDFIDFTNIHTYLMKTWYKIMFKLIRSY